MNQLTSDILDYYQHNRYDSVRSLKADLRRRGIEIPKWLENIQDYYSLESYAGQFLINCPDVLPFLDCCENCREKAIYLDNVIDDYGEIFDWCEVCVEDAYTWESDGRYHTSPEPEPDSDDIVMSYHDNDRSRLMVGVNLKDETLLGIEIETYIEKYGHELKETIDKAIGKNTIFAERDGSLSDDFGVEFIFKPTPFSEIRNGCYIHKCVRSLQLDGARGWDAGKNYGMHISVNASVMTPLHIGKFCHFINCHESLCEKIAGRSQSTYARYYTEGLKNYRSETDKYLAATRRSKNRVEVRIFRSSLNWQRIKRNCQFIDSVRIFTKEAGIKECTAEKYLKFLSEPRNKKRYLFLWEFLNVQVEVKPVAEVIDNPF